MEVFKKNQNAPRPSEHPPVRGRKVVADVLTIYSSTVCTIKLFVTIQWQHVKSYAILYRPTASKSKIQYRKLDV